MMDGDEGGWLEEEQDVVFTKGCVWVNWVNST